MTEDELFKELEPLAASLDLILVDCRMQQTRFGVVVQVVVFRDTGLGTDDCAALHRVVGPRLELLYENKDLKLEISSPGLDRKFRTVREYVIFRGRGVHVVCKSGREYRGILSDADANSCTVVQAGVPVRIELAEVARTRLDYTQEGTTP